MIEQSHQDLHTGLHYLTLLPQAPTQAASAIVYLHGIGERGQDLALVKNYGLPALVSQSAAVLNCPLFCPQLEAGLPWEADRVALFIAGVKKQFQQVALIGYSWGGSGVCEVVGHFGSVASLAICIAGQASAAACVDQTGVRFLAIQGELDPWPKTAAFVDSVNARGGVAHSLTLANSGHYISELAMSLPEVTSLLSSVGIQVTHHQNAG